MTAKQIITCAGMVLLFGRSFAQKELPVINNFTHITWMGIDFSKARFIGDYNKFNTISKGQKLITDLDDLMLAEKEKFDVAKMMHRKEDNVKYQIDITKDHNSALDIAAVLADSTGDHMHLQQPDIQEIVNQYDFKDNTGLGMMFIVETFNKKIDIALIWITFINLDTKEVIMARRMTEEPGGFGLRNYWSGAIDDMMARVRKTEFKKWKDQILVKANVK